MDLGPAAPFSIARAVQAAAESLSLDLKQPSVDLQRAWKQGLLDALQISALDQLWADGIWAGGILTDEPWQWIREVRGQGPFLLFFPSYDSKVVFQAETAADLARILDAVDVAAFSFAVSRSQADFALVKFSEGGLRGFGKVVAWLNRSRIEPFDLDRADAS